MQLTSWSDYLGLIFLRYFIVAGLFWVICYFFLKQKISFKKIQINFPTQKDYIREIFFSIITIFIFSAIPTLMLLTPMKKYTQFYSDLSQHSSFYFWIAFPITLLIHDAYFYFAHRLMHNPHLFKWIHVLHHRSTNPSPFTAFSFHPIEAVIEGLIFSILLIIMPLCKWHLFFFFVFQMIYNVYGHLGWELYPKGFNKNWIGKWVNTSICHNQHHHYFKGNYGLYFLWWDKIFGTLRSDYDETFNEVKGRTKNEVVN